MSGLDLGEPFSCGLDVVKVAVGMQLKGFPAIGFLDSGVVGSVKRHMASSMYNSLVLSCISGDTKEFVIASLWRRSRAFTTSIGAGGRLLSAHRQDEICWTRSPGEVRRYDAILDKV